MIEETSVRAYIETAEERDAQAETVFKAVCLAMHPSSSDIARFTRIQRTSVCGRLRQLEKDGRIVKGGKKKDPFTGKTVYYYRPVKT